MRRALQFVSGLVVVLMFSVGVSGTAFAGVHPWHATQTDGGLADGWMAEWTVNPGMAANGTPGSTGTNTGQRALFHLFFSTSQGYANENTNFYDDSNFEEVGVLVGKLDRYGPGLTVKFYWASCITTGSVNCTSTDYVEGPMSPAPPIVVGDTYTFQAVGTTHVGQGPQYWWDLFITDDTTHSLKMRGGGTVTASQAVGCCSSYADWGFEGNEGLQPPQNPSLYKFPQTDVTLSFKPTGNMNYLNWAASTEYGASPGGAECWYAENTDDDTEPGCQQHGVDALGSSAFVVPWYYYRSHAYSES